MSEKQHPCWAKVNKALKERNSELDLAVTLHVGSSKMGLALYIPLRKLNPRKHGLTKIAPVFCPFCGEKLP